MAKATNAYRFFRGRFSFHSIMAPQEKIGKSPDPAGSYGNEIKWEK